jgi:ribosome-binding protein aMBF1 (putative translation factor)
MSDPHLTPAQIKAARHALGRLTSKLGMRVGATKKAIEAIEGWRVAVDAARPRHGAVKTRNGRRGIHRRKRRGSCKAPERPRMITVSQIKAARALLEWSQEDLSARSGVPCAMIARIEASDRQIGYRRDTISKIEDALDEAGIELTNSADSEGPEVRLRKRPD